MSKSKKIQVRPVHQTSVGDKQFRRVLLAEKRIEKNILHPIVVVADLKKGSLNSLARYIREKGSIADSEICKEILNLIEGQYEQSRFRAIVVDHPDAPSDKGGRPEKSIEDSPDYKRILARFDELPIVTRQQENAINDLADELKISRATIFRVLEKRKQLEKLAAIALANAEERKKFGERRQIALNKLRHMRDENENPSKVDATKQ